MSYNSISNSLNDVLCYIKPLTNLETVRICSILRQAHLFQAVLRKKHVDSGNVKIQIPLQLSDFTLHTKAPMNLPNDALGRLAFCPHIQSAIEFLDFGEELLKWLPTAERCELDALNGPVLTRGVALQVV